MDIVTCLPRLVAYTYPAKRRKSSGLPQRDDFSRPARYVRVRDANASPRGEDMTSIDDRAVRDTIRRIYTAWAANDADALAALYVEDATVVQPGIYRQNRDDVRAGMAEAFAGPLRISTVVDEVRSVRFLGDDAAVVISEGGIVRAGETELRAERAVRATWVLAKQDVAHRGLPQQPSRDLSRGGAHRRVIPRRVRRRAPGWSGPSSYRRRVARPS
jgi:uncharacterized protein (TIGR02246 family)